MCYKRNRVIYIIMLIMIILLGLYTRRNPGLFPNILNTYLGDTLWAVMIFIGFGLLFSSKNTWLVAVFSILFCYIIELSQLYHGGFIDSIRETTLGGLVLGFGFLWSDIIAYTLGIGIGLLIESTIFMLLKNPRFKF